MLKHIKTMFHAALRTLVVAAMAVSGSLVGAAIAPFSVAQASHFIDEVSVCNPYGDGFNEERKEACKKCNPRKHNLSLDVKDVKDVSPWHINKNYNLEKLNLEQRWLAAKNGVHNPTARWIQWETHDFIRRHDECVQKLKEEHGWE